MTMYSVPTLKQRGYHMTEQDVELIQAQALLKHQKATVNLAAARSHLAKFADEIEALAKGLREMPRNQSLESYSWLKPERIQEAIQDVSKAESDAALARDNARNLGVAV